MLLGAFLLLFVVIFFFGPWPGELLSRLLEKAIDKSPSTGRPAKEEREEARRNRRRYKLEGQTQLRAFKWFCAVGATFLFLNLVLPASYSYRLPNDWFLPVIVTGMAAGFLVIFVAPSYFGGRRGWAQWTFWVSLLAALIPVWELSHLLQPRRRGGIVFLWLMGIILFVVVFNTLRRIEAHERSLQHPEA